VIGEEAPIAGRRGDRSQTNQLRKQLSRSRRRFMLADAKIISGRSRYRVGFFTVRG